jgi:hypothetical protein
MQAAPAGKSDGCLSILLLLLKPVPLLPLNTVLALHASH